MKEMESLMGRMSKNKGAGFERRIAKDLSAWLGVDVRRTPLSGGWATGAPGDLMAAPGEALLPFTVECKATEDWTLGGLIYSPAKCQLSKFIRQARRDGEKAGLPWLLVAKQNRKPPLVFAAEGTLPLEVVLASFFLDDQQIEAGLWDRLIETAPEELAGRQESESSN